MKFLKKLGVLILTIIALVLVIALFVQKDYHVSRTIDIAQEKDIVFDYIKRLKNQEEFAIWQEMDPNVKKTYIGKDGTVGAIYKWESDVEEVGVGEQEIIKINDGNQVDFELRFKKPWKMAGTAYISTKDVSDGTSVTWGFKGTSPWPWNFFFLFMDMDEQLGPDLQKGLDNLKKILESNVVNL